MRQDGEASVEEILESIKKVIARDNRAAAFDTRRRRESEGLVEPAPETAPEPVDEEEADDADVSLQLGLVGRSSRGVGRHARSSGAGDGGQTVISCPTG